MADTAPILLAVDGTPATAGALRFAVREAARSGRTLVLAHVAPAVVPLLPLLPMDEDEVREIARDTLEVARRDVLDLSPSVAVRLEVRVGSRVERLLELAASSSLVVLGRDLPHPLSRLATGAVSTRVAGRSACPSVVVPSDWAATDSGEDRDRVREVVVGLKSETHADVLLGVAFDRAARLMLPVRVVHAWQLPDAYVARLEERATGAAWLASGQQVLDDVLKPWRRLHPDVPVLVDVVHDKALRALARAAETAEVVVIGRGQARHSGLGATARAVLLGVAAPVVVVPPTPRRDEPLVVEVEGSLVR